jgi:outer membrane murein-binding lipoprotein Lpp
MKKVSLLGAVVLGTTLLTGCGSTTGGDILGGLGSILGSPSATQSSDVQATVNSVDTANQRIDVNVNTVNNLRNTQSGQSIYYDNNTRVVYGNTTYNVTDLERGDQISVQGVNNGGRYVAQTITVVRNVRG